MVDCCKDVNKCMGFIKYVEYLGVLRTFFSEERVCCPEVV